MSAELDRRALERALAGAPATGEDELDAAVARAAADIAAIRAGLVLVAEQLRPAPDPSPRRRLTRGRRLGAAAFAVALAAVVAVAGWVGLRSRAPGAQPPAASARLATDSFDYRPGTVAAAAGFPFIGYGVPELSDISASSAHDAWVVGSVAWHWDGRRWRRVALPDVAPVWNLASVADLAPGDAWAVGSSSGPMGEIVGTHPLVERWDGDRFRVVPVPMDDPGGFDAVSADAPNDVWAVGWWLPKATNRHRADAAMRPLIAHWDGRAWTVTRLAGRRPDELAQVVAVDPGDVWAAGPGLYRQGVPLVRHWDGARWRAIRAPFGPHDPGFVLAATSAADAWAVGGIRIGGHTKTIAAHWDGHTWMIAPTPDRNTDSALVDAVAVSPTDVWALGQSRYTHVRHNPPGCATPCTEIDSSFPIAIYEHWNGRRWSLASTSSARMMFEGPASITATRDGGAWAAGGCYWQDIVTRWNGSSWVASRHPPDITWQPGWPARNRHPPKTSCLARAGR